MKLVAACTTLVALPCSVFTFAPTLLPAAVAPTLRARSMVSRSLNMVSALPEAPVITDPALAPAIKKPKGKRLHVQIEDGVYDLTAWRNKHPAGAHWIDQMEGRDATDVMYAFHSDEAMDMFRRLPRVKGATALEPSQLTVSFRQLRKRLVDEGWFDREWKFTAYALMFCT
eukprot:17735-Heterococcus_DN1.PRE.1